MKKITYTLLLFFITLSSVLAQKKLPVDLKKSIINWIGHAEIGSYAPAGTLKLKTGFVTLRGNKITSANITVDMGSLKQDNEDMMTHLKDKEFFDVKTYPQSRVIIKSIIHGQALGTLTIKNKTGTVSFPVSISKENNDYVVTGTAIIDRTKYGIVYNSNSFFAGLGDKAIRNTFDIAFTLFVSAKSIETNQRE
ncbi:YceI family protein [Mucilaginibacter auburnensis]|uniref:Polyisoprenoid-binding protein YceI n=1 Tax=Mucilaginibacter auburnensis TaxID=1457233 RepID=A0A2H9VVX4_9SPHI|nr:YceI family protein [Mucilaginibacter auburnensis]PJJ84968.1 polyisoprenoid-binding protein YceI [Mucilaginibacter auburnensis]